MSTDTNGIDAVITGVVVAGSTGTDIAATAAAPMENAIPASRIAAAAAAATHDDYDELLIYLVREHTVMLLTVVSDSSISCAVSCSRASAHCSRAKMTTYYINIAILKSAYKT